jgi:hypothetical protein
LRKTALKPARNFSAWVRLQIENQNSKFKNPDGPAQSCLVVPGPATPLPPTNIHPIKSDHIRVNFFEPLIRRNQALMNGSKKELIGMTESTTKTNCGSWLDSKLGICDA